MNHDLWSRIGASDAALEKLRLFESLTAKWTVKINLISKSTVSDIWTRHIEDSAHILLQAPGQIRLWADFGSGGGFPGLVVATILNERCPDARICLVESDQRKSTFLREAARQMGLKVEVRAERAEAIPALGADVVSARALASLDMLCGIMERHSAQNGIGLFPKGETWAAEVAEAQKNWIFDLETAEDPGHKGSAILKLGNLRRASRDANE